VHPRRFQPREWLYLELGERLDDFLKCRHKRTRNTLKRRVRKLREHGAGRLDCQRVETEDQVDEFHAAARSIAEQSWQFHHLGGRLEDTALNLENLRSYARIGCLRAYLLKCGDRPCAFVIGYQYEDILQLRQTAYAAEFSQLSPGTVLYYMLLEDLYSHRRPRFANHGTGVTRHKRLFSNRSALDTSVYLFRPTVANKLRCLTMSAFATGIALAKRMLKRDREATEDNPARNEDRAAGGPADHTRSSS
jgi:hypothetical protein